MASPSLTFTLIGRSECDLAAIADFLSIEATTIITDEPAREFSSAIADLAVKSDLTFFCIHAQIGVDPQLIAAWSIAAEYQLPRAILITGLTEGDVDFDDIILICERVLDPVITPYLILHNELGKPCGVISLDDHSTIDYSTTPPTYASADQELIDIVSDFRTEYVERCEEFGLSGVQDGLTFPALPIVCDRRQPGYGIGLNEVTKIINVVSSRQ